MKKGIKILILGLCLLAVEYIILFCCIQVENMLNYSIPITKFSGALRDANEITLMRLIFYFILWAFAIYFFYSQNKSKRPVVKLALMNSVLYISTSLILIFFLPGGVEFFSRSFFFYLVAATLISPFIIYLIPWLKVFGKSHR
jgi:hypothetical protein